MSLSNDNLEIFLSKNGINNENYYFKKDDLKEILNSFYEYFISMTVSSNEILEETGYSYSGISDLLRNEPERKNELLQAIDSQYCLLRDNIKLLDEMLKKEESHIRSVVSCFLHFHNVLKKDGVIDEDKLAYQKGNENVIVHIEGANTIKYTYYKRCDI